MMIRSRRSVKLCLAVLTAAIVIALARIAAADNIMVTKAPPPASSAPFVYNWSGFYAGGHLVVADSTGHRNTF